MLAMNLIRILLPQLLFTCLLPALAFAEMSCARDTLRIKLTSPLGQEYVSRAGGYLTIKIPLNQFRGLGEITPQSLNEVVLKREKQHWQLRLPLAKDMDYKLKREARQMQVVIMKHACASLAKKVIIIDPGHGGKDPGAIAVNKAKEKVITLAIAKKLQQRLAKDPRFAVYLTRDIDEYIPLRERILRAQKHSPDLFISIHADSAARKEAKGVSVYALSVAGATSEQAKWLADHQNKDVDQKNKNEVMSMLFQLTQTASIVSSLDLGSKVLASAPKGLNVHAAHVEQAGFVVLKAFDVPSILVETGFLSSPEESKRLINPEHQDKVAQMIEQGVRSYFSPQIRQVVYTVQAGDTLLKIAKKHDITLREIQSLNPSINPKRIRFGDKIKLPGK